MNIKLHFMSTLKPMKIIFWKDARYLKVGQSRKANDSSKKWTNEFDFTTMIPQVNLFLFIFSKKLKRHQKDILKLTDL